MLLLSFDDHVDMTGKTVEIMDDGISTDDGSVVALNENTLIATGVGTAKVRIDGEPCNVTVQKPNSISL